MRRHQPTLDLEQPAAGINASPTGSLPGVRPACGNRVRVCHVVHTLTAGGAQDLLVELAATAGSAGLHMHVLSLTPLPDGSRVVAGLGEHGAGITSLGLSSATDPRGPWRATRALRLLTPHVVHSHGKHADTVAAVAARRLGLPLVSTLHLIEDDRSAAEWVKTSLGGAARGWAASSVITVSEAQGQWYVERFRHGKKSARTLHNGVRAPAAVPPSARAHVRAEFGVSEGGVLAVTLGLLRPDRGHQYLLDAVAHMSSDLTLVVAGDGPLRAELEARARQNGGARVVFAGYREDVDVLLAASDIVIHPSLSDALPTALIRALASGRPIVATNVGGIPEIVTPDVGVLVRPADVDALAAAVVQLLADRQRMLAMSRRGPERYRDLFTAEEWTRKLREIYLEAARC
jgi:glycosyltransferase involved in cell wall biosynthesis